MTVKSAKPVFSQDPPIILNSDEDVLARKYYVIEKDGSLREAIISASCNFIEKITRVEYDTKKASGELSPKTLYLII